MTFSPKVKIRVIWTVLSHFDNDSLALVGFIASARSPSQLAKFGCLTWLQDNLPNCILPNAHSPNVNLSNAFCRRVFLPTCQKCELLKVEMSIRRNANLPKCKFAEM